MKNQKLERTLYTEKEYKALIKKDAEPQIEYVEFENGTVYTDEGLEYREGHLFASSYQCGILKMEDGEYVHYFHFTMTKLGKPKVFATYPEAVK